MQKQYAGQKCILKLKNVADESETGLNFSRNRHGQCFHQTASLRESCVAFREGPQKNGERANLAQALLLQRCMQA